MKWRNDANFWCDITGKWPPCEYGQCPRLDPFTHSTAGYSEHWTKLTAQYTADVFAHMSATQ